MGYKHDLELTENDKKIFQDLTDLELGMKLELVFQTKDGATSKRHLIYSWLNRNKLKQYYRVYWPAPTTLVIKRLDTNAQSLVIEAEQLPPKLDSIFRTLIGFETVADAHEYLNDKRINKEITPEEFGTLLVKYDEFMK